MIKASVHWSNIAEGRWLKTTFVIAEKLSSYHSLWRHRKICKKKQEPKSDTGKENIVGDIINKVVQRANMDVKPMTEKTPSLPKIPMQVDEGLKPKSLTDLEVEMKSDAEEPTSSS